MKTLIVGDFQHEVLVTIHLFPTKATVTDLSSKLEGRLQREIHNGEVSRALKRLEMRGLVEKLPIKQGKSKTLAGRPKRYYALTELGHKVIEIPRVSECGVIGAGPLPV